MMQQITLNIIFDGTKIRLDASGIQPGKKRKSKMTHYAINAIFFSSPPIKVHSVGNNEFDIAFSENKTCSGEGKNNPLIAGSTICQHCYSEELGNKMVELRKSKRKDFFNYQLEQVEDKTQWLKEMQDFVTDNERFFDQSDYSTSSDFRQIISDKQDELNPASTSSNSSNFNLTDLLSNFSPPSKSNAKLKTNLTVPQIAYLFKLLYELKPDIFDVKSKAELQRFISANFSTKGTTDQDISTEKLKQLFSDPDADAAVFWRKHFLTMLDESRKFN